MYVSGFQIPEDWVISLPRLHHIPPYIKQTKVYITGRDLRTLDFLLAVGKGCGIIHGRTMETGAG